ncbi:NTP transferase domain-containing protein, partial [Bacillus sp. S34]|nr:NTP transferase domain-containing protein [Bacillus sp. S34]
GTRLGIGTAKAFVPVAGTLMLARALEPLFALASPTLVVVVAPSALLDDCRQVVASVAGAAVATDGTSGAATIAAMAATIVYQPRREDAPGGYPRRAGRRASDEVHGDG